MCGHWNGRHAGWCVRAGLVVAALVVSALFLTGCTSGILGGGKPTSFECDGKGMVVIEGHSISADCTKFRFRGNVE